MKGDWQHVFTGRKSWPLDPQIDDLDIRDIAHSLSQQCRFGGHSSRHYSIAEHSLLVLRLWEQVTGWNEDHFNPRLKLCVLMHDGGEGYIVDIPKPVKADLTNYAEIEERQMQAISARWRFPWPMLPGMKEADGMALAIEKQVLFGVEPDRWKDMPIPPASWYSAVRREDQNMREMEHRFLTRFYDLCDEAGVRP